MKQFLIGASTAAHQVEGNNINSDFWAMEQMKHSAYKEPSLAAVDHYNRFREDIDLMSRAKLNAYRFSIEWARIEPKKGAFDEKEMAHYVEVVDYCKEKGIEPIVTLHHFSSPKWLICEGGWENEATVEYFERYCTYVIEHIGNRVQYVCTINEANMGVQLASIIASYKQRAAANVQVGVNLSQANTDFFQAQAAESMEVFGTATPQTFLTQRTEAGDKIIIEAHLAAKRAIKSRFPEIKVGLTFSLHDIQVVEGGEERAAAEWDMEFLHYLPYIKDDDFIGVQNYTRKIMGKDGSLPVPQGAKTTQMGYEWYPQALENVVRKVASELSIPILITENGVATDNDIERKNFILNAVMGVLSCYQDGIPVIGYCYWSLLDNFEWQEGFSKRFGLIAVDRTTQIRVPKQSLDFLGALSVLFLEV